MAFETFTDSLCLINKKGYLLGCSGSLGGSRGFAVVYLIPPALQRCPTFAGLMWVETAELCGTCVQFSVQTLRRTPRSKHPLSFIRVPFTNQALNKAKKKIFSPSLKSVSMSQSLVFPRHDSDSLRVLVFNLVGSEVLTEHLLFLLLLLLSSPPCREPVPAVISLQMKTCTFPPPWGRR